MKQGAISQCSVVLKLCLLVFSVCCASIALANADHQHFNAETSSASLTIFVPRHPVECDAQNPWQAGRWVLRDGGSVPSKGCLALAIELPQQTHAVLMHQGPDGTLSRLWPRHCDLHDAPVAEPREHWYPQTRDGRKLILELDDQPGEERFYLLSLVPASTAEADRAAEFLQLLSELPTLAGSCATADAVGQTRSSLAELKSSVQQSGLAVQWHQRMLIHY